jgi:glycerate 2-kinase
MDHADAKTLLLEIYQAALAAAAPGPALIRALRDEPVGNHSRHVWLIALGKAAAPMASAAVGVLAGHHLQDFQDSQGSQGSQGFEVTHASAPAGGLIVPPVDTPAPHPSLAVIAGDHPEPGTGSLAAAAALDRLVKEIPTGDTVWVLLSGGTTSLIGAPQPGIALDDLKALYARLLRSGLDIKEMNRVRKRFTRWSGGRLARSLAHARVRCYIVSDVIGDDLAAIGSGPCVPDPSAARDVRDALVRAGLWNGLGPSLRQHLDAIDRGDIPETPKAGDPVFDRVESRLIATNRLALEAARRRAAEAGLAAEIVDSPLIGEAAIAGARIAEQLLAGAGEAELSRCLILGGETTVTIADQSAGVGGRSQELALAAARILRGVPPSIALLSAGTDGRDGPTDAAGAIVDGTTWDRIAATGRDPQWDLQRHDSYAALAAADALIKTGPTGTNVMDVVIGLA